MLCALKPGWLENTKAETSDCVAGYPGQSLEQEAEPDTLL